MRVMRIASKVHVNPGVIANINPSPSSGSASGLF